MGPDGAGVGRAQGMLGAAPVQAEHGGVVVEVPLGADLADEVLHGLAGVQAERAAELLRDVEAGGVAFDHPVGDHQDPVAGQQSEVVDPVAGVGEHAERQVGGQRQALGDATAQQVGRRVARVDQMGAAAVQVEAQQQSGDELVITRMCGQRAVGVLGLFDQGGAAAAGLAQRGW